MFECYLDGCSMCIFYSENDAITWCEMYDGDKFASYEYIGEV